MEYGESKEGYWTSEKFIKQIKISAMIAEFKYPKDDGYRVVWILDHSNYHGAYSKDFLNAYIMNAKPAWGKTAANEGYCMEWEGAGTCV